MRFFKVYRRAVSVLGGDRGLVVMLGCANVLVAALQFLDPLLFGRVIGLLTRSDGMAPGALWTEAAQLLGLWFAVGAGAILANIATSLHSERMAHRNRLSIMNRYFGHVLSLPLSFHGDVHSGRLMKVMLGGSDSLFGLWLTFFKDQLSTIVAVVVLLPLTFLLNWRLAMTLVVLLIASINYQLNLGYVLTFLLAGSALVGMHVCHSNLRGITMTLIAPEAQFAGASVTMAINVLSQRKSVRYGIGLAVLGTDHWSWTDS